MEEGIDELSFICQKGKGTKNTKATACRTIRKIKKCENKFTGQKLFSWIEETKSFKRIWKMECHMLAILRHNFSVILSSSEIRINHITGCCTSQMLLAVTVMYWLVSLDTIKVRYRNHMHEDFQKRSQHTYLYSNSGAFLMNACLHSISEV